MGCYSPHRGRTPRADSQAASIPDLGRGLARAPMAPCRRMYSGEGRLLTTTRTHRSDGSNDEPPQAPYNPAVAIARCARSA